MDAATRQRDLQRIGQAHADLVTHLDDLVGSMGADPALPSLLPGWTRGHVLTHIARNADSFVRVLVAAERGQVVSQYEGGYEGRAADIERGAARDWLTLVDDVQTSGAELEACIAGQSRWDLALTGVTGESTPHVELPFRRWREVLVHHADIGDAGFTAEQWPDEYVREELSRMEMLWNARRPMGATGLPALALQAPPTRRLEWLLGRAEIDGLEPAGVY